MTTQMRGQTTLDFAVGTGVFLLAVLFVVTYAPTMFDPFAGGTGTKLIVADRAATALSSDLLAGSTADPGALSTGCVVGFFQGTDGDQSRVDSDCPATIDDVGDLDRTLSLDGRDADVTIHEFDAPVSTPASHDASGVELYRTTDGSTPGDIAVATRTVSVDGRQYRLTVRVW